MPLLFSTRNTSDVRGSRRRGQQDQDAIEMINVHHGRRVPDLVKIFSKSNLHVCYDILESLG